MSGRLITWLCGVLNYPPIHVCCAVSQTSGIWFVSCDWLPLRTFESLSSCCFFFCGKEEKSLQCYFHVCCFGWSCMLLINVPILNIGGAPSSSMSASVNANEAASIKYAMCTQTQISMTIGWYQLPLKEPSASVTSHSGA